MFTVRPRRLLAVLLLSLALGACAPLTTGAGSSASTVAVSGPTPLDRVTWDGGDAVIVPDRHGSGYVLRASNGAEALFASSEALPMFDHHAIVLGQPLVVIATQNNPACPHALTAYNMNGRYWSRYVLGNCGTTVTYEPTPTGMIVREQIRANRNHTVWTFNNHGWDPQSQFATTEEVRAMNATARATTAAPGIPFRAPSRARLQTPSAVTPASRGTVDAQRYRPTPGHLSLNGTP